MCYPLVSTCNSIAMGYGGHAAHTGNSVAMGGRSLSMPGIQVSFVHNAKFSYIHLGIDCIQQNFQSLAASIEFMTRLHLKMSVAQTELNLVILGMRTPCS